MLKIKINFNYKSYLNENMGLPVMHLIQRLAGITGSSYYFSVFCTKPFGGGMVSIYHSGFDLITGKLRGKFFDVWSTCYICVFRF